MGLNASKATVGSARLRMAISGPTKSGKTIDSLIIATNLVKTLKDEQSLIGNGRIILIDTEDSRAKEQYADVFDFDHYNLYDFSPESYMDTLKGAAEDNYSVTIVDQISNEWAGKGGALEIKDNAEAASGGKLNNWTAFRLVTPRHNEFKETIVKHPTHIICTMRSKMDHVQERNDNGGWTIRRVGMQPVQREDTPYEFDVEGDIEQGGIMSIKARGSLSRLIGNRAFRPGPDVDHHGEIAELGKLVGKWIAGRADSEDVMLLREQIKEIQKYGETLGLQHNHWKLLYTAFKISSLNAMTPEIFEKIKKDMLKRIAKKDAEKQGSQV